ncbi:uncharacterized protein C8R40DRAFT_1161690 [Lentinula edodes]|uniref:uncharacterized protein n=1 Tax=Lentinula edodes TaxID=5353 RepID=UPI001E8E0660|nr:uncharacterized protein C8R40DRAFT_1161690 [Lentinula edodes]KAH7873438.1 hypothetical protein C8R40DRAFT_1161690 [Lentinula edodes]
MSLLSDSALAYPFSLCLFSTAVTYIASVLTSNVSQVDRLWTFLPTIYTAYFALAPLWPKEPTYVAGIQIPFIPFLPAQLQAQYPLDDLTASITFSPRALLILTLINLWMLRLSYNTFRRGLFSLTDEDYRWSVLRRQFNERFGGGGGGKVVFQIVNFTFIAATQNVLLMALGWPAYLAVTQTSTGGSGGTLVITDYILALWALGVLVVEFTADNQQFVYQTYKHTFLASTSTSTSTPTSTPTPADHTHALRVASTVAWPCASPETDLNLTPADAHRGFLTSGLWRYSRHPNFACEQAFWWLICGIPAFAGLSEVGMGSLPPFLPALIPFLPALALSLLFLSSTAYTEAISASKYPLPYSAYQSRVPMFGPIPLLGLLAATGERERRKVEALVWGGGDMEEKRKG